MYWLRAANNFGWRDNSNSRFRCNESVLYIYPLALSSCVYGRTFHLYSAVCSQVGSCYLHTFVCLFVCLWKNWYEVADLHCPVWCCAHFQAAVNDVWKETLSGTDLELWPVFFGNFWHSFFCNRFQIRTSVIVSQRGFRGGTSKWTRCFYRHLQLRSFEIRY